MAAPPEFSAEGVRQFIIEKGGKVTNQQLVKHFKVYLTNTDNKEKAKKQFKDFVNSVASIKKIDKEKYLVLNDKDDSKRVGLLDAPSFSPTPPHSLRSSSTSLETLDSLNNEDCHQYDRVASPAASLSAMHHSQSSPDLPTLGRYASDGGDGSGASTPLEPLDTNEIVNKATPVAPPRRKSTKENKKPRAPELPQDEAQPNNSEPAPRISVKEQAQKLNKMASESQLNIRQTPGKKRERLTEKGNDDDDTSSVTTLDPRARTWQLKAAQADYQELAKLLREEPKLAKNKDFLLGYTALHWGAKHGNADIIKLIAGSYRVDVNSRSHGGYTALHLAAMHRHKDVYDLLVQTYNANEEIRDYSGKKAKQYLYPKDPSASRPSNQRPSSRNTSEKDLSFLRFGSINVKVRKTAEALAGRCEGTLWKGWGSAESIPDVPEDQSMPPPKSLPPSRRNRSKNTLSKNSGSLESLPSMDSESRGQQ